MDIKTLRAKGAIVKAPPVPVEVVWVHEDVETGEVMTDTFTVHVRRMSVGWLDRVFDRARLHKGTSRTAALISEGVRFGEDGSEAMSYEDAYNLEFGLSQVLVKAFDRVNETDEAERAETKNLQPPMSSGTSSSSTESAAGQ